MTYPRIEPATDPDAPAQAPIGTVLIRYPNLSGALVTVAVADYPRGTAAISPSPELNRVGECGGCGELYGSTERGNKEEDARKWAQSHSETCRALPPAGDGPDFRMLAHQYATRALDAARANGLTQQATAELYAHVAEIYAALAAADKF